MSQVVCLFHDDCFDGTASAWALFKRFPDAEFINVRYNNSFPSGLEGKVVYIVDFCYPLNELLVLSSMVEEVYVLDHHKGMDTTIAAYNEAMAFMGFDTTKFNGYFDGTRSGAKITWETLMSEYPTPRIIDHVSDRDLWNFELPETKAVMAGLSSYLLDLHVWDRVFQWTPEYDPDDEDNPHHSAVNALEADGYPLLRKMEIDVNRLIDICLRSIVLEGFEVPFVNMPRTLSSEALEKLAIGRPFAVGYFDTLNYREFSLRSTPDGEDLIPITKVFGGGGHAMAAGFRVGREHPLAQI